MLYKSCKTCLTDHTRSHYIMPRVINALGGGHTDADTHIPTREPNQFQKTRCTQAAGPHAPGLKTKINEFHWHLVTSMLQSLENFKF